MQKTFAMSCTEVYEIINSLPKEEFEKIPLHEIEFLKKNKDNEYKFIVDKNINIEELNISKRANAMIVILWEKYLVEEINLTKAALSAAYANFDNATDPDLIDCYIYQLNSEQKRYKYLLQKAKESEIYSYIPNV